MELMTNDEARNHFKEICKDYSIITPLKLRRLQNMIETELINYLEEGTMQAKQMHMTIASIRKNDSLFENGKMIFAQIQVNGSYFSRREAVTFNRDGFIGFGGELSTINIQPILKAFCKWCTAITIG